MRNVLKIDFLSIIQVRSQRHPVFFGQLLPDVVVEPPSKTWKYNKKKKLSHMLMIPKEANVYHLYTPSTELSNADLNSLL